jgi:two-component system copper resistance phosphate regulon response regulator CusR
MRVLVVEQDPMLGEFLRGRLAEEEFDVRVAADGAEAERLLETEPFHVMVLDLSLPEESGLHALREARARRPDLVILVLAPGRSPADCVKGLDAGADDYLAKPFSYVELIARIRALLRRRSAPAEARLKVEDLVLDRIARTVQRGRHRIDLTQKEFELLEFLMERPFQPVPRDLITEKAWELEADKPTNLVAVYINYLRKKIDAGFDRPLIRTIRGVGYQIGEREAPSEN